MIVYLDKLRDWLFVYGTLSLSRPQQHPNWHWHGSLPFCFADFASNSLRKISILSLTTCGVRHSTKTSNETLIITASTTTTTITTKTTTTTTTATTTSKQETKFPREEEKIRPRPKMASAYQERFRRTILMRRKMKKKFLFYPYQPEMENIKATVNWEIWHRNCQNSMQLRRILILHAQKITAPPQRRPWMYSNTRYFGCCSLMW